MTHPECQVDKNKRRAEKEPISELDLPRSGRDIIDLAGPNANVTARATFRKIGLAYDAKQAELTIANQRILELEAQIERMKAKKRKTIPNPNKKFMQLGEIIGGEEPDGNNLIQEVEAEIEVVGAEDEVESEMEDEDEDDFDAPPPDVQTRSGRAVKMPSRYT